MAKENPTPKRVTTVSTTSYAEALAAMNALAAAVAKEAQQMADAISSTLDSLGALGLDEYELDINDTDESKLKPIPKHPYQTQQEAYEEFFNQDSHRTLPPF